MKKQHLTLWQLFMRLYAKRKIKAALSKEDTSFTGSYHAIVFDTETTGLDRKCDEIIQISIINDKGECLLNTYVKPYWHKSWEKATKVNGITPEMVKNAPYPHEIIPMVKSIFEHSEMLIAYNNPFDLAMLKFWGINADGKKQSDVMLEFAEVYGEWNEKYQSYKWKKLTEAADYYGYKYKAHDSLEDVRATLYVYKKMHGSEE